MELSERREEIIANHKAQERYDPHWKAAADRGSRLSEQPVAFLVDDEVVVIGDDVTKIYDGLQKFVEMADEDEAWEGRAAREPSVAQALAKARQALERDQPEELRLPQQWWNAYLFALDAAGVRVTLADGTHFQEE